MIRKQNTKNVHLRFSPEEHRRLARLKEEAGLTWEEWFLKLAGIEE